MKKLSAIFLCLLFLLPVACGKGDGLIVTLSAEGEGCHASLCDEDGLEIGTAELKIGKNVLPVTSCYLQCAVTESTDCPVVYTQGEPVSLTVLPAEHSDEGYLHTFTVFLKGWAAETCFFQICREEDGALLYCKTADFSDGIARIALADGTYQYELYRAGEAIGEGTLEFTYLSTRYKVFDLGEE